MNSFKKSYKIELYKDLEIHGMVFWGGFFAYPFTKATFEGV